MSLQFSFSQLESFSNQKIAKKILICLPVSNIICSFVCFFIEINCFFFILTMTAIHFLQNWKSLLFIFLV